MASATLSESDPSSETRLTACLSCRERCIAPAPTESIRGEELLSLYSNLASTAPSGRRKCPVFILDSGASSHMTPIRDVILALAPWAGSVSLGDMNVKLPVRGRGLTRLADLSPFLFVPKLTLSLISLSVLDRLGYHTTISGGRLVVTHHSHLVLTGTRSRATGLYHLDTNYVQALCNKDCGGDNLDLNPMNSDSVLLAAAEQPSVTLPVVESKISSETPTLSLERTEAHSSSDPAGQSRSTPAPIHGRCPSSVACMGSDRPTGATQSLNPRRKKRPVRSDSPARSKSSRLPEPESIVLSGATPFRFGGQPIPHRVALICQVDSVSDLPVTVPSRFIALAARTSSNTDSSELIRTASVAKAHSEALDLLEGDGVALDQLVLEALFDVVGGHVPQLEM